MTSIFSGDTPQNPIFLFILQQSLKKLDLPLIIVNRRRWFGNMVCKFPDQFAVLAAVLILFQSKIVEQIAKNISFGLDKSNQQP